MTLFKGRHLDWLSAIHDDIFLYERFLYVRNFKNECILKGKSTIVY